MSRIVEHSQCWNQPGNVERVSKNAPDSDQTNKIGLMCDFNNLVGEELERTKMVNIPVDKLEVANIYLL